MSQQTKISAIIIAKNEETRIATCLLSIRWVYERIVVDNNSTDDTAGVAKKYNAQVIKSNSNSFSTLRTLGMEHAQGDWILYVDADEEVSEKLHEEITRLTGSFDPDSDPPGYFLKRNNFYLGHVWPKQDRMQRLFWRKTLKGWRGELHETAIVEGSFGQLHHPLIHRTHRTLEEMVQKTNVWSEIEAKLRFSAHHPDVSWWRLLRVMTTAFTHSFFNQGGWRAGTVGLIESIYQACSIFITYAKLWELQKE